MHNRLSLALQPSPIKISIYTDGGYFEKYDLGGWGFVIFKQTQKLTSSSDYQHKTSSLEMELTAAVEALLALEKTGLTGITYQEQITLFTDSRVLIEGLSHKIDKWRSNQWIHKSGNAVKYQALWLQLDALTDRYQVEWQWVKGHNGNVGNTLADGLARQAVMTQLQTR